MKKSLNKEIIKLTIPNIISNISVPLVGTVDTILMGHLSAKHLAALGSVSTIFLFIYGSLNFLRAGTTGITAQDFGAKKDITQTLYRAVIVAIFLGIFLISFKEPIKIVSFYLMNIDNSYYEYANNYFDIRVFGAIAVFLNYAIIGWFFGAQNSIYPLIITLILNISNILLSYYLVVEKDMGITGAAIGTVASEYLSVVVGAILILRYKKIFKPIQINILLKRDELKRFFIVNRDFFIRTLFLTLSFAFFYSQAAKGGVIILGAMTILIQYIMWFAYIIDGFANAAEAIVGKYYGAKNNQKFSEAIKIVFIWGFGVSLISIVIFWIYGIDIAMLYTDNSLIIEQIVVLMPLVILSPLITFIAYVWDGVFIALTASRFMRDAVVISTILYVALFFIFKDYNYSLSLWGSFLLFFLFRGVIQTLQFIYIKKYFK